MVKWKPERTNTTEKGRKSNEKGRKEKGSYYTKWKEGWEKLKKVLNEGQKRNKQGLTEKELEIEIPKQYSEEDVDWLKCNPDHMKT